MDLPARPMTPNTVMYEDENAAQAPTRPASGVNTNMLEPPPGPPTYNSPDEKSEIRSVGKGIWTVEGDSIMEEKDGGQDEDEETRILLEKEFDDYYEDQVHKSAGPVVFVSKMVGMLPAIWTDDDEENECKSYFNVYTFIIFAGWICLAVVSGLQVEKINKWPGQMDLTADNKTSPLKFITRTSIDAYFSCTWAASIVAILFGVFKCKSMADVLLGLSETDAQLELTEKHYAKLKRNCFYWVLFLSSLLALHGAAFGFLIMDCLTFVPGRDWDLLIVLADLLAHSNIYVLELQFIYLSMSLSKRFKFVNKIMLHVTKPWKTFKNEIPPNYVVRNILQYQFDQIWEPNSNLATTNKIDIITKKKIPLDLLTKAPVEQKISKEEENTFILQLDILRGIYTDLSTISQEVNKLLGFQVLTHIITSTAMTVMFGYFFVGSLMIEKFYWPFFVLCLLPAIKILIFGHFGQALEHQAKNPFMTICQVSSLEGSPRLERMVQKLVVQMRHLRPEFTAAGYFSIGRNMILKTIGLAVAFTFFMVKFDGEK